MSIGKISSQAPQECGEGSTTRSWSPDRTVKAQERAGSVCKKCGAPKQMYGGKVLCKSCHKAKVREYYEKHKQEILVRQAKYSLENAEKRRRIASEWAKKNRHKRAAICAAYYTAKMKAIPQWADRDAIEAVYEQAQIMSLTTGVAYHVDHIVPLQGKNVCGLHVHWNLQVIPALLNASKSNRFTE